MKRVLINTFNTFEKYTAHSKLLSKLAAKQCLIVQWIDFDLYVV